MKKIIVIITVAILLGLEFILLPLTKVNANVIDDAQETIIQEVDDATTYALGALLTGSQGGTVKKDENYITKMQNLGRDTLRNAYANGKRVGDIIAVNGNELLFNPTSLFDVIGNTWRDFAEMELTWITEERGTIYFGTDFSTAPGEYKNTIKLMVPELFHSPIGYIRFYGVIDEGITINKLYSHADRPYTENTITYKPTQSTTSYGFYHTSSSREFIGVRVFMGSSTKALRINSATVYAQNTDINNKDHIPLDTVPDVPAIQKKFSSTFKENFDEETGLPINNNWYTYDYSSFETSTVNSSFVTNEYTTIIEEPLEEEEEGEEEKVYVPDEEGGGSFWGALLDLISTFISTIGGLLESVINAIGNIVPSIIDFLNNAFIPRESYFKDNFTEIQTKAEEKAPDFEPVTQVLGAFDTTDQPSTWDGIQVNIPAFGINNITIVDPIMIDRYGRQIKTWVRMILLLMTSLVLIKRVSQVMGK